MKNLLVLCSALTLLLNGATLRAAADEADLIKGKITQFYQQLSTGQFEEAFVPFAEGSRGYLPYGLLNELPNKQVISAVVSGYAESRSKGAEINLRPKNILVTFQGDVAIATYYVDGNVRPPSEERRGVVSRATLIWAKMEGAWKIVHWHISDMKADPKSD